MNVQTRFFPALISELLDDEGHPTATSIEQKNVEKSIRKCYDRFEQLVALDSQLPTIYRLEHLRYIEAALRQLSSSYVALDSSRPWLIYWILNAATLLGHRFDEQLLDQVVSFLGHCRSETGGFGGGPGQLPHLAPTYAAVNALCLIGTERALHMINRRTLKGFLTAMREPNGAFLMHVGGETDIRGAYCAVSVAKLANFSPADMREMFAGTVEWIASCQTYEGGIGGAPDLEAHGGYTFCGVAALALLGTTGRCDLKALMRWSINRQMRYEGGFQGRSNKLVDGCYSFWQGAVMPIVQALLYSEVQAHNERCARAAKTSSTHKSAAAVSPNDLDARYKSHLKDPLFHRGALQEYVLICCQRPTGGLVDKPGKPQDLYHTCYTLSGLAVAQHCELDMYPLIVGNANNEVGATHPLYNIPARCVWKAGEHFRRHNYDLYASDAEEDEDGYGGGGERKAAPSMGGGPDLLWPREDIQRMSNSRERDSTERSSSQGATSDAMTTDDTSTATSASVATTNASGCTSEDEETAASN